MDRRRLGRAVLAGPALVLVLLASLVASVSASAAGSAGAVYTLTNAASGNAVLVLTRGGDGALTVAGSYPTGGLGNGGALGSQGSLTLSHDGRWLLAVNAGSDSLSVFAMRGNGLTLTDTIASGGSMPISVTLSGNLVYVLNAGGAGNISGFTLAGGQLAQIPGSTRPLSNGGVGASVGPAQVQFSPDGRSLVVTEKTTNLIDTYALGRDGLASGPVVSPSNGTTPFGFDFTRQGTLVVSEAATKALSSYALQADGTLATLSSSVPTNQTAPCWVVVTPNGKFAYTTNAGSASISGFAVSPRGTLSAVSADGVTGQTGGHPTDLAMSHNGQFLYSLDNASQQVSLFAINADGSLTNLGALGGLPASAVGLAAQ